MLAAAVTGRVVLVSSAAFSEASIGSRGSVFAATTLRVENLARTYASAEPFDMAFVVVALVALVVLGDVHEFVNRPRKI